MAAGPDNDALLIERARAQDQRAFAELVGRYRGVLWGVCLRITGNSADAEDAVQEAMIAAWRHLDGFREESRFSTWLYRIASNAALAVVRRRRETSELPEELPEESRGLASRVADADSVQRALAQLPESFRVALVLREYGGFSYAEIATHQGILVETVKTRLNRARTMMRAALAPDL
jgi:RNA polymerase sigma factor (sigma-70 family)